VRTWKLLPNSYLSTNKAQQASTSYFKINSSRLYKISQVT